MACVDTALSSEKKKKRRKASNFGFDRTWVFWNSQFVVFISLTICNLYFCFQ